MVRLVERLASQFVGHTKVDIKRIAQIYNVDHFYRFRMRIAKSISLEMKRAIIVVCKWIFNYGGHNEDLIEPIDNKTYTERFATCNMNT